MQTAAVFEVQGDVTGRIWRYEPRDRVEASGEGYRATASDDGSAAYVRLYEIGTYWEDELERARVAMSVARRPEVAAASTIRTLLDVSETPVVEGEFGHPGLLVLIWEWADYSLHDFLWGDYPQPDADAADEVERNVRAALDVLHGLDLIHLDVAPNNILRVNRLWKLADLDCCALRGTRSMRQPNDERWVHPERRHGRPVPARDEFDDYGLEQVVEAIRGRAAA